MAKLILLDYANIERIKRLDKSRIFYTSHLLLYLNADSTQLSVVRWYEQPSSCINPGHGYLELHVD